MVNRRGSFMSAGSVNEIYGDVVRDPHTHMQVKQNTANDTSLFSVNSKYEWNLNVAKIDWSADCHPHPKRE